MPKVSTRNRIDIDVNGHLGVPDMRAAILKAQEENARIVEDYVKRLARGEAKGYSSRNRNRGDYPGPMEEYYNASVTQDADIVLDNPTLRAQFFELGTEPHEIWASGLFSPGRQTPPRGRRGRFTRRGTADPSGGAQALAFDWISGGRFVGAMVDHPGQEANPVMEQAMIDNLDLMADNVGDAIRGAMAHG